jgi:hypothetical protein
MSERFAGRSGHITSSGITVLISDWVIFRGSRAPNIWDWRGRATVEVNALPFSGLLEGTFEMGGKVYRGDIEVVKTIPKSGEIIFTGISKLEQCTETG